MATWIEILGDYLTINKNFNRIDNELTKTNQNIEKTNKNIYKLGEKVRQNTSQINKLTECIVNFPSKIKLTCHEVFDEKIRTWKGGQQLPQLPE